MNLKLRNNTIQDTKDEIELFTDVLRKGTFALVMSLTALVSLSQQKIKPNKYYITTTETQTLDSIFPVDEIQSITITNYSGTRQLTEKELAILKPQLKRAKFAGGLLTKPGHISLRIKLKRHSVANPGFVYASEGSIHFDGGTSRFKKPFSGTYFLPGLLNFDNYK